MRNFLSHEWHKSRAQKRGGDVHTLSMDAGDAERRFKREPVDALTPEEVYERRWAVTVMQRAMARLREESDDAAQFDKLKDFLTGTESALPYREVAVELDISKGAVKTAVHRLRQRYGQCLRTEIAETVGDEAEVEGEVRHLLQVAHA